MGKHTNELVKDLKTEGYTELYQRSFGNGKMGIIAKKGNESYTAIQDLKTNTMKQKKSHKRYVLTFVSGLDKYTEKVVGDLQGNIKSFVCKLNSHTGSTTTTKKFYQNGRIYQKVENNISGEKSFYKMVDNKPQLLFTKKGK
jgi:hypothetical protein